MSEPASRSTGVTQEQLRLMAVHAHPDDESSKGAATMARYVARPSIESGALAGGRFEVQGIAVKQ